MLLVSRKLTKFCASVFQIFWKSVIILILVYSWKRYLQNQVKQLENLDKFQFIRKDSVLNAVMKYICQIGAYDIFTQLH